MYNIILLSSHKYSLVPGCVLELLGIIYYNIICPPIIAESPSASADYDYCLLFNILSVTYFPSRVFDKRHEKKGVAHKMRVCSFVCETQNISNIV